MLTRRKISIITQAYKNGSITFRLKSTIERYSRVNTYNTFSFHLLFYVNGFPEKFVHDILAFAWISFFSIFGFRRMKAFHCSPSLFLPTFHSLIESKILTLLPTRGMVALLKSKSCLGEVPAAPLCTLTTAMVVWVCECWCWRRMVEGGGNTASYFHHPDGAFTIRPWQPATLSLNVQSFQSTTFNGGVVYTASSRTPSALRSFYPTTLPFLHSALSVWAWRILRNASR